MNKKARTHLADKLVKNPVMATEFNQYILAAKAKKKAVDAAAATVPAPAQRLMMTTFSSCPL